MFSIVAEPTHNLSISAQLPFFSIFLVTLFISYLFDNHANPNNPLFIYNPEGAPLDSKTREFYKVFSLIIGQFYYILLELPKPLKSTGGH